MSSGIKDPSAPTFSFRDFLLWTAGIGACLVILMAGLAFGPSGLGFAAVIALFLFALMVKRYRFSLRTFLIVTTVFGVWLGIKVGRDIKLRRAITTVTSAGGQLKLHDRTPNFPWGLWTDRYNLSFYQLSRPLTRDEIRQLGAFAPSSIYWLDLTNTGVADNDLKFVRRLTNIEFLLLNNNVYYPTASRVPGRPENDITDAGASMLETLRKLRGIDLSGTAITDKSVPVFLKMSNIIWIYLSGTRLTGAGVSNLRTLKNLYMIEMNGCPVSAEGFKELSELNQIGSLGLSNTGMTDADLDLLNQLPDIGILRLGKNKVTKEAVDRFRAAHPRCTIEGSP